MSENKIKYTVSVYSEDSVGLLNRISAIFQKRHINIISPDNGFGIKFWRKIESETSSIFINENVAMWMGWVTLTDKDGGIVKVDKSWGYKKATDGTLKIILHHSSLPYEA